VFVISATYAPGHWDDVTAASNPARKIQLLLPGYPGQVHPWGRHRARGNAGRAERSGLSMSSRTPADAAAQPAQQLSHPRSATRVAGGTARPRQRPASETGSDEPLGPLESGTGRQVPVRPARLLFGLADSTPTIALSGPVDVPSTAGTQYVTATAGGSPSGIADIVCSVDGGRGQVWSGASAQVPVSGVGTHSVSCYAQDNAVDPSGARGRSQIASRSLEIGLPTVTAIAFSKDVDRLKCRRIAERVKVPARWMTVDRHGKRVRVRRGARVKRVEVTRCRFRSVRRRVSVWVTMHHHGRTIRVRRYRTIRVILKPHVVYKTSRRIGHGRSTTVDGWLGTKAGSRSADGPCAC
jgi:hypothetical protein